LQIPRGPISLYSQGYVNFAGNATRILYYHLTGLQIVWYILLFCYGNQTQKMVSGEKGQAKARLEYSGVVARFLKVKLLRAPFQAM